MVALHLSLVALIMLGAGVALVAAGGLVLLGSFGRSDWLTQLGASLAYLGIPVFVIGLGVQVGAWIYA